MSNTKNYAEMELDILSKSALDPDNRPIIEPFKEELIALCDKFGNSGQSGGSAPFTASALSQAVKALCLQEPICPITGIDDEWIDIREHMGGGSSDIYFQNKRCSGLFKHKNGKVSYVDAIVFVNDKGIGYNGSATLVSRGIKIRSSQYIKGFPFVPKTFYIDIYEVEVAKDDWNFYIKDAKQLKEVYKYYKKSR